MDDGDVNLNVTLANAYYLAEEKVKQTHCTRGLSQSFCNVVHSAVLYVEP